MFENAYLRAVTRQVLIDPHGAGRQWQLQGLGMLRLYLTKSIRLHVWDNHYEVPNVSNMHDHPWDFVSHVIAGRVIQQRCRVLETPLDQHNLPHETFMCQKLLCGPGGGLKDEPFEVELWRAGEEQYGPGQQYRQAHAEIHVSQPIRGTVTIVNRRVVTDGEHARVFWPKGEQWVSAEPRPATTEEVDDICEHALQAWF